MHESNILEEIEAPDGQIARGESITVKRRLKNYFIVIQFPKGESLTNAKIINVEQYGWGGIVADNYQDALATLNMSIQENGKAQNIIMHSHGGVLKVIDQNGNIQDKREFISTSHITNRDLRADYFIKQRRLNEEIPVEEKQKAEYYEKREETRKKREEQRELNKAIRNGTANLSKIEIEKLKKEKKWKNKDNNTNGYYDDYRESDQDKQERENDEREYKKFKQQIANEKASINRLVTTEIKEDMQSLESMISCVEDDGYFIFAACNSAFYTNLLQEIQKYVKGQVNLVGVRLLAAYNRKEGTEGELDGNILFSKNFEAYLIETVRSINNKAISISPNGTETYYNNIKIEVDGLEFIK